MPTDAEIKNAKDYLILRLEAERVAVSALDTALLQAARRIVDISRRYNIPPELFRFSVNPLLHEEIRKVLAVLRDALYERVKTLDTFKTEEDPFVAPILVQKDHGKTFRQRLNEYVNHWGYELEATIAAAGLEKVTDPGKILGGIREYLYNPYDNPWIRDNRSNGIAVRLFGTPHYGRGKAIVAHTALATLITDVVSKGWMQNWSRLNKDKAGYYVYRGSSFPCEICDAQVGFLHDINDEMGKPLFHPNCKCFIVYVD